MFLPKGGIIMKKAIIYVRGHKREMQEVFCKLYAADKGYKILFTATDIAEVKDCDVLIVSTPSRISRDSIKYYEILNDFKSKGITVENAVDHSDSSDFLSLARYMFE